MLQPYRDQFNAQYTPAGYTNLLSRLNQQTRTTIDFRIAETPCFIPRSLMNELADTGAILTHQLLDNPTFRPPSRPSPRSTASPTTIPSPTS
jgi:hypothetical protein